LQTFSTGRRAAFVVFTHGRPRLIASRTPAPANLKTARDPRFAAPQQIG